MASITARKGKKRTRYTAQVRVVEQGALVFKASKTFNSKLEAKAWSSHTELNWEKEQSARAMRAADLKISVAEACFRFHHELLKSPRATGRTKLATLLQLSKMEMLQQIDFQTATSGTLFKFAQNCFEGIPLGNGDVKKFSPQRISDFMMYIKSTYLHAQAAWTTNINLEAINTAMNITYQRGYRARSNRREKRPTVQEVTNLMDHFDKDRDGRGSKTKRVIPYKHIVAFLLFSTRRLGEVCRIRWDDLDEENNRILVREMKHPRRKAQNDKWVDLPPRALALVKMMPRTDPRIFPYSERSVSRGISRAKEKVGWGKGMSAHTFRHEGTSYYAELDLTLSQLMRITGHSSQEIDRYMHFSKKVNQDKWGEWEWLERLGINGLPSV